MDLTSRIAVSGCKNGYAVFAVENMDTNSPLLKQGLRDQHSYMRVTEPGHDFFTTCKGATGIKSSSPAASGVGVWNQVNNQPKAKN